MTDYVNPTPEQIAAFNKTDMTVPIYMLNLISFRAEADYPKDHPLHGKGLTGAEAYGEYAKAITPFLKKIGAEMAVFGAYRATLIGPGDMAWDEMFVMHYPSAGAFLKMAADPEYTQHVQVHRTAAVENSRLICCDPAASPIA